MNHIETKNTEQRIGESGMGSRESGRESEIDRLPTGDSQLQAAERRRQKTWAAVSSTLAAIVLTSAKLGAALATGSLGILSEALHSGVDLAGTLLSLAAVRVSERPPDATHPY